MNAEEHSAQHDFDAMSKIVNKLYKMSRDYWRTGSGRPREKNKKALEFHDRVQAFRFPLTAGEMKQLLLRDRVNSKIETEETKFVHLPPLEDDPLFIPVLRIKADLPNKFAEFRVEMYTYKDEAGMENRPSGIGFRFETPTLDSPNHNFHHVQLFDTENGGGLGEALIKLPSTVPCMPLLADEPVSLTLCMIVSLYGTQGLSDVISDLNLDPMYFAPLRQLVT
ncbi:MAG: hypothetical protein OK438_04385 [Thaumarchaeota archaeon]|nr:hypothetical protein [Nitrososphaerota archaeon]